MPDEPRIPLHEAAAMASSDELIPLDAALATLDLVGVSYVHLKELGFLFVYGSAAPSATMAIYKNTVSSAELAAAIEKITTPATHAVGPLQPPNHPTTE